MCPNITSSPILHEQELAFAVVGALNLWSHPKYTLFLHEQHPGKLDMGWFKSFAGEWRVARTIRADKQMVVLNYLDTTFRLGLARGGGAAEVDRAAKYIQSKKWTSLVRKDGLSSLPLSLVSKIGFFFDPDHLIPYDSFARRGLNKLRGSARQGGEGYFKGGMSYTEYLQMFNDKYLCVEKFIANELAEQWVTALAKKLNCPLKFLKMTRFQRKVFDNYLMHYGGKDYDWEPAS